MITHDCKISPSARIHHPSLVNLYGCEIGEGTSVSSFVEIQRGVVIGKLCKIQAFAFICESVSIGDYCFIGPHVSFTNDKYPETIGDWMMLSTYVEDEVSIGAGAIILPGLTLKRGCRIGAGAIVTKDVNEGELIVGNPGRPLSSKNHV